MASLLKLLALIAVLVAAIWQVEKVDGAEVTARQYRAEGRIAFGLCGREGSARNCVHDGDSFRMAGEKIRILSIDAPEVGAGAKCAEEAARGDKATKRLRELLSSGTVRLTSDARDRDQYGRLLRNVSVDGRDVGEAMVREGMAREYRGKKLPWCA